MKKINLLLLLLIWIGATAQRFDWAKRGGLWAYDYGNGIASDNSGNVYVVGKYEQNANFSGVILPCQGNHDIFVAKYNPSGALSWIRTGGGYTGDYATCVATDSKFVYMGGEVEGSNATIKFPGSSITVKCKGGNDAVLAKYDINGNLLWARSAGGYSDEKVLGISYDAAGNVYISGYIVGTAQFANTYVSSRGGRDAFIAKYDANGNFLWVRTMGSPDRDEAKAIKCDSAGNIYICGMYKNNCNFSGQWLSAPNGYVNAFIAKYNTNGNLQWVRTAGGNWDDAGWGITMDNYGKVFMAGEFNADANFSGIKIYTTGAADVFVACYTSSGNIVWVKKAGGSEADRARGIGTDGNNIFITGQFGGAANFGPTTRNASDKSDIFMAALNNGGSFIWATSVGGPADKTEDLGFESGISICATGNNVYATGSILDGGQFGGTFLSPFTRTDVFVTRLTNGVATREENEEPPLALEELLFDGQALEKKILLSWNYTSQQRKDIVLEKSYGATEFAPVRSYYGEEARGTHYSYADLSPNANDEVLYRLRLVDEEGVTTFSRVLSIKTADADQSGVEVFPNPAQTYIAVNVKDAGDKKLSLSVVDMGGREVWKEELVNGCCKVNIGPWSRGLYVVVVRNDEAILTRKKILVE